MINLIFDQGSFKVLSLFSLSPGSRFKRNEIKEKTILYNVTLDRVLAKLLNSRILKKERGLYSINLIYENSKTIISLLAEQYKLLKEVPFDVYLLLADVAYHLSDKKEIEAYLFGSYSKLVYKEGSDVDIAVLASPKLNKKAIERSVNRLRKLYRKDIELHFFSKQEFYKNRKDPLVKDILQNGSRLI